MLLKTVVWSKWYRVYYSLPFLLFVSISRPPYLPPFLSPSLCLSLSLLLLCFLSHFPRQVNGKDMIHASRSEALAAVMTAGDMCTIVVLREESSMETEQPVSQRRTLSTRRKLQNGRKVGAERREGGLLRIKMKHTSQRRWLCMLRKREREREREGKRERER